MDNSLVDYVITRYLTCITRWKGMCVLGEDPGSTCGPGNDYLSGWAVQSGSLHAGVHTCRQPGLYPLKDPHLSVSSLSVE